MIEIDLLLLHKYLSLLSVYVAGVTEINNFNKSKLGNKNSIMKLLKISRIKLD